jgi:hypothetical protein
MQGAANDEYTFPFQLMEFPCIKPKKQKQNPKMNLNKISMDTKGPSNF